MTTNRRHYVRAQAARVTPEAVAAFQSGAWLELHRELSLRPWQHSPLDAGDGPCPDWVAEADWALAQRLRAELQAAVAAEVT